MRGGKGASGGCSRNTHTHTHMGGQEARKENSPRGEFGEAGRRLYWTSVIDSRRRAEPCVLPLSASLRSICIKTLNRDPGEGGEGCGGDRRESPAVNNLVGVLALPRRPAAAAASFLLIK